MVESRIQQNTSIIPSCTLDSDSFMKRADLFQGFCHDRDVMFTQQRSVSAIIGPYDIFDASDSELAHILLLLNIIEIHGRWRNEKKVSSATKHYVCGPGW